jgi:hypothetical protein
MLIQGGIKGDSNLTFPEGEVCPMCNYVFFKTEELIGHMYLLHVPRGMASGVKPDLAKEPLDHLKKNEMSTRII